MLGNKAEKSKADVSDPAPTQEGGDRMIEKGRGYKGGSEMTNLIGAEKTDVSGFKYK